MTENEILLAALAIQDSAARTRFLDQACHNNPDQRVRIEAEILARIGNASIEATNVIKPSDVQATEFFAPSTSSTPNASLIGTVIANRYNLLREIGEGGMGSVFLAEQSEPVKRQVALKLIRLGMDSRSVLTRFEAERQALAMMDHPNIARIYDGGSTNSGQPFFVMELVHGVPITDYCDRERLSIEARLSLFTQVCNAVQHAHQKGIIHRDLKPGNVLVAEVDGRPVCKVIDFGVAKAIEKKLTDVSFADTGMIVGTPAYMSPEQADPSIHDIDTRTDVYALGVMLYELLTGTPPIDASQFKRGAVLEMLRMVREVEPPKPSTRISTADALPNIASNRNIDPAKLTRLLRGELDWVVMKCLEKDRARRYDTASGLARDLQRYLADEAVEARPPTRSYRFRKFVKRNKGQVLAVTFVFLALLLGLIGTTWQAIVADQARTLAQSNENKAILSENAERVAKERALKRLTQIEKSNKILGTLFDDLDITEIRMGTEPLEAVLANRLVLAGKQLDGDAIGEPAVVASLQSRLGRSLKGLGFHEQANELLKKAAEFQRTMPEVDQAELRNTKLDLANNLQALGELEEAVALFQELYEQSKKNLGDTHPETLALKAEFAMVLLEIGDFERAIPTLESNLKATLDLHGEQSDEATSSRDNLAIAYLKVKQIDEAVPLLEKVLEATKEQYGPEHVKTISKMLNLAAGYRQQERFDEAQPLLEQARELSRLNLGSEHPITLSALNSLSVFYQASGKADKAIPLLEETVARMSLKRGADHPETLVAMNNLAATYWTIGNLEKSIPLFESVQKVQEQQLGRKNPQTQATISNLGINYKDAGRYKEALPLLEECHAAAKSNPRLRHIGKHLLEAYIRSGSIDAAKQLLPDVLSEMRKRLPPGSPQLATALSQFGTDFLKKDQFELAEKLLSESLAIEEVVRPDDWRRFHVQSSLGRSLLGQKKFAEAETHLLKGLAGLQEREAAIPSSATTTAMTTTIPANLDALIQLYTETNKPEEVTKYQQQREKYPIPAETQK